MKEASYLIIQLTFCCLVFTVNGQGRIAWIRHTIDASYSGADGIRLADVNNDQLMDITSGWEETGYTKVYLHPGNDLVRSEKPWPSVIVGTTESVEDAVFMDFDKDGVMDVISSTEGKSRKLYFNRAPENIEDYLDQNKWTSEVLPASIDKMQWMFAIPSQIDGKYGEDLIAGAKGKTAAIGWFQSPKNPTKLSKWKWYPISPATWVMSLFIRDMDFDGDLDIVTSDRKPGPTNGVRWLENPGTLKKQKQPWKNHFIGAENLEVLFMDLADLDQDGLEDAIVTEYTNQKIWFFKRLDKTGLNWSRHQIDIPKETGRAKAVRIGDINADGQMDIVHTTNTQGDDTKSGVIWMSYKNDTTDSTWEWHDISGKEGYKYDRIELVDLDGDGDLDVMTCEENFGDDSQGLGVIWYENPLK